MKNLGTFEQWFAKVVVVWQGDGDSYIWEVTDGNQSVIINANDGYIIEESDLDLTRENVGHVFDFLENYLLENKPRISKWWDLSDDNEEQGLYGYGY